MLGPRTRHSMSNAAELISLPFSSLAKMTCRLKSPTPFKFILLWDTSRIASVIILGVYAVKRHVRLVWVHQDTCQSLVFGYHRLLHHPDICDDFGIVDQNGQENIWPRSPLADPHFLASFFNLSVVLASEVEMPV